jgi:signal transduction histidine kinase
VFRAVRLRLIAYTIAILATVLLAAGIFVYVSLTRQFDSAIETELHSRLPLSGQQPIVAAFSSALPSSPQSLAGVALTCPAGPQDSAAPAAALPPASVTFSCPAGLQDGAAPFAAPPPASVASSCTAAPQNCAEPVAVLPPANETFICPAGPQSCSASAPPPPTDPAPQGTARTDGALNSSAGGANDGIFLSAWLDGRSAGEDASVPPGLPDIAAVRAARPGHDDERTVRVNTQSYRIVTRTLSLGPDGAPTMTVQAGISLAAREREGRTAILALAGGGLLGILLAIAGGLLLTSHALAPLRLAFERQRRFIADASHELRTPLALIRLESEELCQQANPAPGTRSLLRQVRSVSKLVDSLLTLARLDHGSLTVELEPVHAATEIDDIANAIVRLAAPGVHVESSASADLWVSADRSRLHQILLILVENACRATRPGGRIEVTARADLAEVVFAVADTGVGIPAAHLKQVFEPFHRVDDARSRSDGGTGLGLAIAQELARAQKGQIVITSELGVGTTATVRMPRTPAPVSSELEWNEPQVDGSVVLQQ